MVVGTLFLVEVLRLSMKEEGETIRKIKHDLRAMIKGTPTIFVTPLWSEHHRHWDPIPETFARDTIRRNSQFGSGRKYRIYVVPPPPWSRVEVAVLREAVGATASYIFSFSEGELTRGLIWSLPPKRRIKCTV